MSRVGPQQIVHTYACTSREEVSRLSRIVARLGSRKKAAVQLGVSLLTLEAALEQGRLLKITHARLMASMVREEAA